MVAQGNQLIQNIVRCYEQQLKSARRPIKQLKAIDAIINCRTDNGGYSLYGCGEPHELTKLYHSCRHRSCWLCASRRRNDWVESQKRRQLDCNHYHGVFTLPHEYLGLWRYNQKWFTQAMFDTVKETLFELMGDEKYHGIKPGVLMALHTWGRALNLHPHMHCLITGGGLDQNNNWKATGDYLLPIKVVKALYRGKFQERIKQMLDSGGLELPPNTSCKHVWKQAYRKEWSVRIEPQYKTGRGVMLYLSRYLKGGPLNPKQIVRCDSDRIDFTYKCHREKRQKVLSLKPSEFLRRLLLHVSESGQHVVRHYGLYSSASRNKRNLCREKLGGITESLDTNAEGGIMKCKTCGVKLQHLYTVRMNGRKGNSLLRVATRTVLQQVDEKDVVNVVSANTGEVLLL